MAEEIFARLKRALEDRYRLDREIGRGGMATVYLAEDLKHRRQVAIKVLSPDLAAALGAERFLREIELAAKLQHPHIVPVYDSGSADGILYYVMPFVEGESLRDLLKRDKRISLNRAAEIVRAAASGLAYAHAQGIVHRDVKPENIMLSDGHAVVTDFGIARAISASRNIDANLTGAGMAMGTPAYMSPEQATADNIDARTDQYALACVFYEMVSGKQAFSGPTMQAMLTSILTGARPKLSTTVSGIPPEVDNATQRALATDPANRFAGITQFADAVGQETSGAAAATRESRRWKKLAIALPMMVAAVAAVYVAAFAGPKSTVVSGAETIAIVPFTTSGAGLEGLSDGIVDLLGPQLDGVGDIKIVNTRAVLQAWRDQVRDSTGSLDDAIAVARETKAASVLMGSIVSTGGTARLTAELFDLAGKSLGKAQVNGGTDSVLILADKLALAMTQEIWRSRDPLPSANVSLINSTSMPAIRAYLKGEAFHRRGMWDSAEVAFKEALQADSTFALAWYRLATTLGWEGQYGGPVFKAAALNAEKYSEGLSPRLRLLMVGYRLFADQDVVATDSAISYTRQFPRDADGWFLLGESQYHTVAYHPLPPDQLMAPFDKVLALDSLLTPAAIHPMELALQIGDTALLKRYEAIFRVGGDSTDARRIRLGRAFLAGADSSLYASFTRGEFGAGTSRAALLGRIGGAGITPEEIQSVANALLHPTTTGPAIDPMKLLGGQILAGLGRHDQAMQATRGVTMFGQHVDSLILSYPIMMGFADSARLERMDAKLATLPKGPYVGLMQAMVALDRGNPAKAATLAHGVSVNTEPTVPFWVKASARVVDGLAMVAQGDTLRGMARADSGMKQIGGGIYWPFSTAVQLRYAQVELARPETRNNGINRLRFSFPGSPDLIPVNTLRVAKAFESAERWDSAAVNYRRFLELFKDADTSFNALIVQARAGLVRTAEHGVDVPVGKKP